MARDALQLVQEAVTHWGNLDGIDDVEVRRMWLGNTSEVGFMARITLLGQPEPVYIELILVDPYERMEDEDPDEELSEEEDDKRILALYGEGFKKHFPVQWREEPWE